MKKILAIFLLVSINTQASEDSQTIKVKNYRETAQIFGKQLKTTLMAAMKSGGPVAAIQACNVKAPSIAADMAALGKPVARTSLKFRNPNNRPDEWEQKILKKFDQWKSEGTPVKKIEFFEQVDENGESYFRYMKAIPTGAKCLACHGESPSSVVAEKLKALYPMDRATGYQVGDIRGAFTFKEKL